MAKKDLKYFMRERKETIVTVPGLDSFVDDDGKVIDLEVRVLGQLELDKINDMYDSRSIATDKKGKPLVSMGEVVYKTARNHGKAVRHIIAEALVYPPLKDAELMKYHNCVDITEMPRLVFSSTEEFQHVSRVVLAALGIIDDLPSDDDDEAENEIDTAKN